MKQNRKATAWKKSRKFGDIHGGRMRLKLDDNIFKREHNLQPPTEEQETPIFIVDNPSRDFYFPATIAEIKEKLQAMPHDDIKHLTHIWLSSIKKTEYFGKSKNQAEFICGSNVYLIKLYAVPKDNRMFLGTAKPTSKQLSFYKNYCNALRQSKNGWYLQWTKESYKKYFLESLLLHEIGHCVDYIYHRNWSKANRKQVEDSANSFVKTNSIV